MKLRNACRCEDHRADELDPREGGWYCNVCNVYFCVDREVCPMCSGTVDPKVGWVVSPGLVAP